MFQILADWLKRRREGAELDALDDGQRARIAHDLGVSITELDFLAREARDPVQMPKMLAALGIDEPALRRAEPVMTRDMLRVCSLCTAADACKYALAQGFADLAYPNFCPNAEALSTLPRRAARPMARTD